jgi:hypothetical protein
VEEGDVVISEGQCTDDEGIEYNSAGPDIDGGALILAFADNFWGGVVKTSTGSFKEFPIFHKVRESEITNFDEIVGVHKDILRLEITMSDTVAMDVLHTVDNLSKIEAGLFLSYLLVLHTLVEFSIGRQLHDHKNII